MRYLLTFTTMGALGAAVVHPALVSAAERFGRVAALLGGV